MPATSPQACSGAFTAALIARDMDVALALLADDVVLFYSNGTVIAGKDAFAATMTASWKVVSDDRYLTHEPRRVAESADAAVVVYGFEWSGVARGQAVSGGGRATRVFRKTAAGWLVAHEHLSAGPWKA